MVITEYIYLKLKIHNQNFKNMDIFINIFFNKNPIHRLTVSIKNFLIGNNL